VLGPSVAQLPKLCSAAGGVWGRHDANVEHCFFKQEKNRCLATGGTWEKVGWAQTSRCVRPTKDAGKPCSDSSECEVACMAKKKSVEVANDLKGHCAATDNPFANCGLRIEGGHATPILCAD